MREGRVGRAVLVKTAEYRREGVVIAAGVEGLLLLVYGSMLYTLTEKIVPRQFPECSLSCLVVPCNIPTLPGCVAPIAQGVV